METSSQFCLLLCEGIGMDTCVIPLRHGGLSLVQTTDYIYPIVDDPYMMVRISTSSLFALMRPCELSDLGLIYTTTLYVLNFQYLYFVGKNRLCQCSKWPVRDGSDWVRQHVDASGSQQQNVREGERPRLMGYSSLAK